MKLKTYEAPTLQAALKLARIELGSEAVLLEAKERKESTAEARFHVTFALDADIDALTKQQPIRLEMPHWQTYLPEEQEPDPMSEPEASAPPRRLPAKPKPKAKRGAARKKTAAPRRAKREPPPQPAARVVAPAMPEPMSGLRTAELAALFGRLVATGIPAGEAARLATRAAETAGLDDDTPALEAALRETLDTGWRVHAGPTAEPGATRLIAFVGPAGAGKTTSAIKAARLLIQSYDRPATLISAGHQPIGSLDVLETWTTLLDLQLDIVESAAELPPTLDRLARAGNPPGTIILDVAADAAEVVRIPGVEIHIVLPATYSTADQLKTIERYSGLEPSATVITRFDEAAAPGSLWSLQRSNDLPASYLSCGPDTPGDFHPATPQRLTQRLLGRSA